MMSKDQLRQRVEAIAKNFTETFSDVYFQCARLGVTTETFAHLCIDELTKQIVQLANELDEEEEENA